MRCWRKRNLEKNTSAKQNFKQSSSINAPAHIQQKAVALISKNKLVSETDVDNWCTSEMVKYYLEKLAKKNIVDKTQVKEELLTTV
jgi:hypothetical protein